MREIKFRAWNEYLKVMSYGFEEINVTGENIVGDIESGKLVVKCMKESGLWVGAPVMQYTGLKDKYGTEVYEGDKVKFRKYMNKYSGTVHFKKGCFIVEWESIVGAYGEKATHSEYLKICENIEIIGNIYQNPELLDKEVN